MRMGLKYITPVLAAGAAAVAIAAAPAAWAESTPAQPAGHIVQVDNHGGGGDHGGYGGGDHGGGYRGGDHGGYGGNWWPFGWVGR
jgi:uncharacterized membrane protein